MSLPSESVVHFYPSSTVFFCKDHNKQCSLKKFEQFYKSSFGETSSWRLIKSYHTELVSKYVGKYNGGNSIMTQCNVLA